MYVKCIIWYILTQISSDLIWLYHYTFSVSLLSCVSSHQFLVQRHPLQRLGDWHHRRWWMSQGILASFWALCHQSHLDWRQVQLPFLQHLQWYCHVFFWARSSFEASDPFEGVTNRSSYQSSVIFAIFVVFQRVSKAFRNTTTSPQCETGPRCHRQESKVGGMDRPVWVKHVIKYTELYQHRPQIAWKGIIDFSAVCFKPI